MPNRSPSAAAEYRYPGTAPFSSSQQRLFFGRQQETEALCRLVRREPLVVLYSKSGLGKSSLIHAGLAPTFEAEGIYAPLPIRFGAWTEGQADSPLDRAKAALSQGPGAAAFLDALLPGEDSLWRHAKARQLRGGRRPLLLFDQFEELFSYPEEQVNTFQQELAELLNTGLPLRYRRRLETADLDLSEAEEDLLESPLEARILFAIRSDRLHLLNRLSGSLPSVLRHSFELLALRPADARDAIVQPAQAAGDGFATPPFAYSPAALDTLLDFLRGGQDGRVEGILLQMLCEHYEREQVEARGHTRLDLPQIGQPADVVSDYYEQKIRSLAPEQQPAARLLIEDGLVSDGEAMRLTLHEAYITQEYAVDKPLLEALVDSRLLRAEPFLRGGYTYELSHDRLVPAVLAARQHRREAEAHAEALRREAEAHAEAQRLQAEAAKTRRQLRIVRVLLAGAVLALVFAGWQYWVAAEAEQEAKDQGVIAEQALENYRNEQAAKDLLEIRSLRDRGDRLFASDFFKSAKEMYEQAGALARKYPERAEMKEKIHLLEDKLNLCNQKLDPQ